jgi:hypothetical protein
VRAFLALLRRPGFRAGLFMALAFIAMASWLWSVDMPVNSFTIGSALSLCAIFLFPTFLWIGLFLVGRDTSTSPMPSKVLAVVEYSHWYSILDWRDLVERLFSCTCGRVAVAPEGLYFMPLFGGNWQIAFSDIVVLENELLWTRRYYKLRRRSTGKIIRFYVPENVSADWQVCFAASVGPLGHGAANTQ